MGAERREKKPQVGGQIVRQHLVALHQCDPEERWQCQNRWCEAHLQIFQTVAEDPIMRVTLLWVKTKTIH